MLQFRTFSDPTGNPGYGLTNFCKGYGQANCDHDARGNLSSDGTRGYGYTAENRLATLNGSDLFAYDPLGRLYYTGPTATWSDYDGGALVTEIHYPSNSIRRRWVPAQRNDAGLAARAHTLETPFSQHSQPHAAISSKDDAEG